jgi:hypothetical protein
MPVRSSATARPAAHAPACFPLGTEIGEKPDPARLLRQPRHASP